MGESHVLSVLTEMSQSLEGASDFDETLTRITHAARDNVPNVDYASISILHEDGRIETVAATDPVAVQADSAQYELREGPCFEAVVEEHLVRAADVVNDARWPRYGAAVGRLGLRAQMALQLYDHPRGSHGALNLYSTTSGAFDDPEHLAELFTRQATMALGFAEEISGLKDALGNRKLIGQAIGIVMERYAVNEGRALAFLIRASQASNVKLREVARTVVQHANNPEPPAAEAVAVTPAVSARQ